MEKIFILIGIIIGLFILYKLLLPHNISDDYGWNIREIKKSILHDIFSNKK